MNVTGFQDAWILVAWDALATAKTQIAAMPADDRTLLAISLELLEVMVADAERKQVRPPFDLISELLNILDSGGRRADEQ